MRLISRLIADRAYDTDEIITFSAEHYKIVVIPSKRNRKLQRDYDKEIYKMRHFVENVTHRVHRADAAVRSVLRPLLHPAEKVEEGRASEPGQSLIFAGFVG